MNVVCVIPARFASTRFPGKPLADLNGYPMIQWVYTRAAGAAVFSEVIIATDDERIRGAVQRFDAKVIMTSPELASGTDRVARVAREIEADIFVNLQGDEPLISADVLTAVCTPFDDPEIMMATPVKQITNIRDLENTSLARVIVDKNRDALYFTRAVIPFNRDGKDLNDWLSQFEYLKHIGLYAYRKSFLLQLTRLPPGKLEQVEKLEQLRVLEYGYKIKTVLTEYESMSIDTPEDLERVSQYIKQHKISLS